ncbi:MAG: hypothetical protein KAV87_37510, partial [Desulfobacteraceae bacterium]|nr:hypothetical protein [Desulfobacteraceae bacterium]
TSDAYNACGFPFGRHQEKPSPGFIEAALAEQIKMSMSSAVNCNPRGRSVSVLDAKDSYLDLSAF